MPEPMIASLFKSIADLFPSTLGAVVSMQFMPKSLNRREKMFAIICAYTLGTYFGRAIVAYFEITNPHISDAIMFGSSLFGLSFSGNVMEQMGPFIQSLAARWGAPPVSEPPEGEK